jgi:phosphoribosylformylglycinamidine (FGAM) synthase-like enzyme
MAEACRALDFPIVSGNVSLYNETKNDDGSGSAILPTPAIGGIGLLDDVDRMATIAFKAAGEHIVLIGDDEGHLGQSLWLRHVAGREEGPPPPVDLDAERRNGEFVRGVFACRLGVTGGDKIAGVTLAELRTAHEGFFPHLMGGEIAG